MKHDIEELAGGHDTPTGSWSDGATLWLLENGDGADDAVYAYDLSTGQRVEDREFELDERNRAPRGVWSDDEGVVWVADSGRDKLFAYDLATGERLEERDIELAEGNRDVRGIWSDGETMWVLDERRNAVFAYDLESGALLAEYSLDSANGSPTGLWSDGVTLWVSDPGSSPRQLFAYRLPTREEVETAVEGASLERVRDEEFEKLSQASNNSPRGIWASGDFMYVADASDGKVYTYNMPDAIDARLASLTLSGIDIGEFEPDRTDYQGVIAKGVTETTVTAKAMQRGTQVAIDPPDAKDADGYQVVIEGVTEIAITVTSPDGTRTRAYRVVFEPTVTELALGPSWTSFEWPGLDGVILAEVGLPEEVVAVYTWDEDKGRWLGYFPGLDHVPGLNTLTAFSSGATYWVVAAEDVTWTAGD
ncbi:MAG: PQQ-binding-like beta-propeller repeat protein [Dehalococcoidia bacterium]|nr:PQQ-binding-like beta-propeller repeat protein [Dehalococcoidia bacterium]